MTRPRTSTRTRRSRKREVNRQVTMVPGETHTEVVIERALIIRPEPLEWILSGKKVWEIRTKPTKIRGPIALLEKGTKRILGICKLVDCIGPLTVDEFIANARKMNYTKAELEDEREELGEDVSYGVYSWVLAETKRLPKPVRFQNPSGAVTWARLPSRLSDRLVAK